jgi:hypothetical protein
MANLTIHDGLARGEYRDRHVGLTKHRVLRTQRMTKMLSDLRLNYIHIVVLELPLCEGMCLLHNVVLSTACPVEEALSEESRGRDPRVPVRLARALHLSVPDEVKSVH